MMPAGVASYYLVSGGDAVFQMRYIRNRRRGQRQGSVGR